MADEKRPMTDEKATVPKDGKVELKLKAELAVVLYPALGNPAIVQQIKEGNVYTARLNLIILCQTSTLTADIVAQHLKISTWAEKDKGAVVKDKKVADVYKIDKESVTLSPCCLANTDNLGLGLNGNDNEDTKHDIKLSHLSIFPWILESFKEYQFLYKITINLKKKCSVGMYNIWWVNEEDYHKIKERASWWNLPRHCSDLVTGKGKLPRPFKRQLKEYSDAVNDTSNDPKKKDEDENIRASIYHPFFVTTKKNLSIGHVTDIHLDSRMDVYGQCEASVIEVKENCPPVAQGNIRKIANKDFHVSIKDRIANFNNIFTNICNELITEKKADAIVITGDLVDYNRGLHSVQTHRTCFTPISEVWEALGSNVTKDTYYKDDRNWFMFYKKLLELYKNHAVPIFTMLGNHDYVNYGMAPWPKILGYSPWNGVFDQNLTLYESALCFGEGYNSGKAFRKDIDERTEYVEWYTIFINPFMDYVVNYGDLSMFMVDWGVKSNVIGPGAKTASESVIPGYYGKGGLHQADNLFKEDSNYKNYSIYKAFLKQKDKVKILFMHATGLCPRDDISIGQINFDLKWNDNRMKYGSFDKKHDEIIEAVENGELNLIVAGHSHRNVVMVVDKSRKGRAQVVGSGEDYGIVSRPARNVVMVTSSGGPLPKYLPGGPMICACTEKYAHGWDTGDGFFEYTYDDERDDLSKIKKDDWKCIRCGRSAKDMEAKKPKRHRPGGSLLTFEKPANKKKPGKTDDTPEIMVSIQSVPATLLSCYPRRGVLGDEHQIFTQGMKLEHIDSYEDFSFWKDEAPISIISRKYFDLHGYMEFPDQVNYVTFTKGRLSDKPFPVLLVDWVDGAEKVRKEGEVIDCERVVRQFIGKEFFEYFMIAAKDKKDFAFGRYTFKNTKDTWDREIKMNKEMETLSNNETENPSPRDKDPYNGLVMNFLRIPDLDKRKRVCGY